MRLRLGRNEEESSMAKQKQRHTLATPLTIPSKPNLRQLLQGFRLRQHKQIQSLSAVTSQPYTLNPEP